MEIEVLTVSDDKVESEKNEKYRIEFENKYYAVLQESEKLVESEQALEANLSGLNSRSPSIASCGSRTHSTHSNNNNVRLPKLDLPKYEGRLDEWLYFKETFDSLINNNDTINDIEKLIYLRSVLKDYPADLIESLEVTGANYEIAWELLNERFSNEKLLVLSHVKALFELPNSTKESFSHLRLILDGTSKHLRALKTLKQAVDHWDTLIVYLVSTKLDNKTQRELEKEYCNELPTVANLGDFLKAKCRMLENLSANSSPQVKNSNNNAKKNVNNFVAATGVVCFHCDGKHLISNCEEFAKLSVENRFERIKDLKLCLNCFKKYHRAMFCKAPRCKKCNRKHNFLIHDDGKISAYQTEEGSRHVKEKIEETASTKAVTADSKVALSSFNGMSQVLLSTAIVRVKDVRGKSHEARVLLDSGSESQFITQELANKLQLQTSNINVKVTGMNESATDVTKQVDLRVQAHDSEFYINVACLVVPSIGGNIPCVPINIDELKMPEFVQLADKSFYKPGKVDMLIGSEYFWQLVRPKQHRLGKNKPILQDTSFGWIVAGLVPTRQTKNSYCGFTTNQTLHEDLTRFWELETCPDRKILSPDEKFCERDFKANTTRQPNGRFVVRYPLKLSVDKLGKSREIALKRFAHTERKLERDLDLKLEYKKFIREYEELGHLTRVEGVNDYGAYYLPHHCVIKQNSLTTKLRVVFDASAKSSSGYSFNDLQVTGPVLQQDLFEIVVRFRKHRYVITADVTKMYRQILIHEEQKPFQRIFWRNDVAEEINCYQLNTVTYGTASASYLAVRCMLELAREEKGKPLASLVIERDFYMDDLISGGETTEEVRQIYQEVTEILKGGCFTLNKWSSNDPQVLKEIQCADKQVILNMNEGGESKTLGLSWHANEDEFQYSIILKGAAGVNTKRSVLSVIAQIFDPLGLLGPTIITANLIMQRLWQYKFSWDDPIPTELNDSFCKFREQLPNLNRVKIKRHVICKKPIRIELHGFSDASEVAYGAAIYLRSIDSQGKISCHLLCAKSRVAPLKTLTVPRLELCAAYLLANLYVKIEKALDIEFSKRYFWCYSQIVLAWISSEPHLLKMFIANRVAEIQGITEPSEWGYINTLENPADLLTRGVEPQELENKQVWWNGPLWLTSGDESWPSANQHSLNAAIESEEFKGEVRSVKTVLVTTIETDGVFDKFSSFKKLQRVWSYCIRFCKNAKLAKENRQFGGLTNYELSNATISLIKLAQREMYEDDLRELAKTGGVKNSSKMLALNPFLDPEGTIRVGGRLKHSEYEFEKRHPAILAPRHPLARLLINAEHVKLLHAGPQAVLASLRERVWIVAARGLVRKVIKGCVTCFKVKPVPVRHIMADLPEARVTAARPFINCGIDFAGPFLLKDRKGRKYNTVKAYVRLFICLSSRAIHLELVSELTTDAFMAALHRFVSRRGNCLNIFSGNGTNFVGAKRELYNLQNSIKDSSSFETLNWHFIPPRAPHFGGSWEAGVKSFKFHFNRIVKDVKLTFEEFVTIITQIEGCLNSRPLYPMSNDPNDPTALTPGHFLIGHPIVGLLEPPLQEAKMSSLKRFQFLQQMKQQFWSRWSKEYVSEMQVRTKWKVQHTTLLKIGVLVLVKEDNLPPLKWELGRVQQLHPGRDGIVRAVTLKTKTGVIKRPAVKVCILPQQDAL